jgi:hypothetical protein
MRKAIITLLFVHIAYSFLHAQEYEFYSTFTNAERIGKEHVENKAHGETLCIVYLGRMDI